MKTKIKIATTILTVCLIALSLAVITSMDNNTHTKLYEGLIILGCLFVFVATAILQSQPEKGDHIFSH